MLNGARTAQVALVALLLAALTACDPWPAAVTVHYPDDPRVLQGEWALSITEPNVHITDYAFAPNAGRLFVWYWSDPNPLVYEATGTGDWVQVDTTFPPGTSRSTYDPSTETFIWLDSLARPASVRVIPVDGSPPTTVPVALLEEDGQRFYGTGRAFQFTRTGSGANMYWVNAFTGEVSGPASVPHGVTYWEQSRSGSMIVGWEYARDGWRVSLIDTTAPLPAARTLVTAEQNLFRGQPVASADGRWFVYRSWDGDAYAVDLNAQELASKRLDIQLHDEAAMDSLAFAADTHELVWRHAPGELRTFDLMNGESSVLSSNAEHGLLLDRDLSLILGLARSRQVSIRGLGAPTASTVLLPEVDYLGGAALDLSAEPLATKSSEYDYGGTVTFTGGFDSGRALTVSGHMTAWRVHDYVPSAHEMGPQVAPPPRMWSSAEITDPTTHDLLYELRLDSEAVMEEKDRHEVGKEYFGTVTDNQQRMSYHVTLARSQ